MSSQVKMDNTCLVIMLILYVCIDQGDGHWKERDRETFHHDIELYRKMTEKIEREIKSFYDEYPEERYEGNNVDRIHYKHVTHKLDRKIETRKQNEQDKNELKFSYGIPSNVTNSQNSQQASNKFSSRETMKYENSKSTIRPPKKSTNTPWPKFDDILSAMGKKYDWKNDRWVKFKEKIQKQDASENNAITKSKDGDSSSEFHEKHKFSYRIVKLKKSKNRRNIVVAVSAVR